MLKQIDSTTVQFTVEQKNFVYNHFWYIAEIFTVYYQNKLHVACSIFSVKRNYGFPFSSASLDSKHARVEGGDDFFQQGLYSSEYGFEKNDFIKNGIFCHFTDKWILADNELKKVEQLKISDETRSFKILCTNGWGAYKYRNFQQLMAL